MNRIDTPRRRGNRDTLLALLASNRIDRREFLKRVGAGGVLMLGGPALLAACGGETGGTTGPGGDANQLFVDNWIEYIDLAEDGSNPTIDKFTADTGISVTYTEGVNSNEDWFGKYQPQLAAGQPLGIDVTMLTDYMAARMIRLGYAQTIDKANVPNISNLTDALKSPGFDPNRDYTLPWASGYTAIGYDIDATGREITSIQDLLDPAFAGRVGLLEGYDNSAALFLLMEGKDPATASVDDFVAVAGTIGEAVSSGQVRQVYGNDYLDALLAGDLAIAVAYSGDIIANQESVPSLRWCFPEEGFTIFTDNMLIPTGAANKANAEAWMNHYYDPEIAAELAAGIQYATPVNGAREAAAEIAPDLLDNEFVFPSAELLAKGRIVRSFSEEEEQAINDALGAAAGV